MRIEYTNQSPRLFAGFYDSVLYNYDLESSVAECMADDSGTEYEIADWNGYQQSIAKDCAAWLFEHLPNHDIIKSMDFKELWSPREYNFMTDRLTFDCEIDDVALKNYCFCAHRELFGKYLYENWSNRSGFISFIPNNLADFENEPDMEIMIEFYLLNELDFIGSDSDETGFDETGLADYEQYCYELANDTMLSFMQPVANN